MRFLVLQSRLTGKRKEKEHKESRKMRKNTLAALVTAVLVCMLSIPAALGAEKAPSSKPVASVPNEDAYLYATGKNQFLARFQGLSQTFAWEADSAGYNKPQMRVFDYNGDGEKDLAVSLCLGTGTGIDLYGLHIVTIENGELIGHSFQEESYLQQIREAVAFAASREKDKVFITFSAPQQILRVDITGDISEDSPQVSEMKLACGNVVSFNLNDDGTIVLKAALGSLVSNRYSPDYHAYLLAKVLFAEGQFTLSDIRISTDN